LTNAFTPSSIFHFLSIHVLGQALVVFLLGVHLKVHNVALVPRHFFVIADENLVGALTDQPHVVADDQYAALEGIDAPGQRVNGWNIQLLLLMLLLSSLSLNTLEARND
jgi:hypothetical protein